MKYGNLNPIYHYMKHYFYQAFVSIFYNDCVDFPFDIEIETINRCNNGCSFCPVNVHVDPRPEAVMSEDLIGRISEELGKERFSGRIALYCNNEPLIDKRLPKFVLDIKRCAPDSYIYISTNGILIKTNFIKDLFKAGLDELIVNNYEDDLKLIKPVERFTKEIEGDDEFSAILWKIRIVMRKKTEVLSNRSGNAPNIEMADFSSYYQKTSCLLPFSQFVIQPGGLVSLCCSDALGEHTLGDLNKQTIREIWHSKQYQQVRNILRTKGRKGISLCARCDFNPLFRHWLPHFLRYKKAVGAASGFQGEPRGVERQPFDTAR